MAVSFSDLVSKGGSRPSAKPPSTGGVGFADLVPTAPVSPPSTDIPISIDRRENPLVSFLHRKGAAKIPGQFLTGITGAGQAAIRLLGTLLATPITGASPKLRQEAAAFVREPLKTDERGLPSAPGLAEEATNIQAQQEAKGNAPSFLGPVVAVGSQLAETLGDPLNAALGFGSQLGRASKTVPTIGEAALGIGQGKPPVDLVKKEGQSVLSPTFLKSFRTQAADQVAHEAPDLAPLVRNASLKGVTTIPEAEARLLAALPPNAPKSVTQGISTWARSMLGAVGQFEAALPADMGAGISAAGQRLAGSTKALAPEISSVIAKAAKEPALLFDLLKPRELPAVATTPANPGRFNNPIRSVESRLESLGQQGGEIIQRFKEADTVGLVNTGKVTKTLQDAGIKSLTAEESQHLGDALRGLLPVDQLPPNVRGSFDVIDAYRTSVPGRAREFGVQVRTSRGKTFDFPEAKPNYFPQNTPPVDLLKKGQIRDEVLANSVRSGRFSSPQEATQGLDSYISIVETNGKGNKDFFAHKLVAEGQAKNLTQAKGKILRFFRNSRQQRYGNLERARELDFPFFDPNPQRVIPRYVANVERRLAEAEVLGPNLEHVDQLLGSIKTPDAQAAARLLVKTARGANELGDAAVDNLLSTGRRISTFRLSPLSAITNLGQNVNTVLASDASSFVKGLVRGLGSVGKDLAIESGAIAESSLRQVQKAAGGDSGLTAKYMRGIGFTASERFNRITSANTGWSYVQKLAKRLVANPTDNLATRELSALELNPADILKNAGLTHNDLLRGVKVFVDRTQFRSRPVDLPASFTKSALGQNLSQFKTFSYQQGRFLAKQTLDQLRAGNSGRAIRNIGLLATVYPLTGEALGDIRAVLQGRTRKTKGLARYFEDLTYVGGLGLLTDTVQSLKYNPSEFLLGPSVALLTRNAQAGYKALTGTLNQGNKRALVGQVPLFGPFLSNRLFPPKQ